MGQDEPRRIGPLLMTGLVSLPILFVWMLLRSGYARSTRNAPLFYTFTFPALSVATMIGVWLAAS